jgi:uncharacterized membrane protein
VPGAEATAVAIVLMAALTYTTRAGGLWLMALAPVTPRVERFLNTLSGSLLAALVASSLIHSDVAGWAGVAVAGAAVALTRQPLLALGAAAVTAALFRF